MHQWAVKSVLKRKETLVRDNLSGTTFLCKKVRDFMMFLGVLFFCKTNFSDKPAYFAKSCKRCKLYLSNKYPCLTFFFNSQYEIVDKMSTVLIMRGFYDEIGHWCFLIKKAFQMLLKCVMINNTL